MVNHFRTLLLNRPPITDGGMDFAQYIEKDFLPVRLEGAEAALRTAIMGGDGNRSREEFLATMMSRLVMDFDYTRAIVEEIDPRVTFDQRLPSVGQIPAENLPIVPKIAQIWRKVGSMGTLRVIFSSSGTYEEVLTDLSRLIDTLKRDDHRLATACCAYCLRLTERL